MTAKQRMLVLVAALLVQPALLKAQPDSLAFDQGRLRIWCETARFVYDDNEADSLLPSINCQSWSALQTSLRGTDAQLGVMRLMNTVDKPAIYTGYTDTEKKLQKLSDEIVKRLRESPARAKDPERLERVGALAGQLQWIARQADPTGQAGTAAGGNMAQVEPEIEEEAFMPPPGEPIQLEPKNVIPWNEVLQWLALLLLGGYLLFRLRKLENRYSSLKKEFRTLEQQVNSFIITNNRPAPVPPAPEGLSEKDVREVVKEELEHSRESAVASPEAASVQVPLPMPVSETKSRRLADEPAPATAAEQPPVAATETAGLYYDKMPFRGGFHQNEMSRERQRDSLYTIRIFPGQTGEGEYWLSEDPDIQRYAMQNGLSFFEEGCEFTEVEENPSRVVNEQKGRLRREGAVWKILRKAQVRFE